MTLWADLSFGELLQQILVGLRLRVLSLTFKVVDYALECGLTFGLDLKITVENDFLLLRC